MNTRLKRNITSSTRILLVSVFCGVTVTAQAKSQISFFDREEEWQGIEVNFPGYSGPSHIGFHTDRNSIRIAKISGQLNAEGSLTPPKRPRVSQAKFLEWCALKPVMRPYKEERLKFELQVQVNPFATALSSGSAQGPNAPIENRPELVDLTPRLTLQPDSLAKENKIKIDLVEAEIKRQLTSQLKEAKQTGSAKLILAGLDDLACDLAQGKAWLSIAAKVSFEAAKLARTAVVSPDQLGLIYEMVKRSQGLANEEANAEPNSNTGATLARFVLGGANLGAAVTSRLETSLAQFGQTNLLKLYKQMFQVRNGHLKDISTSEYSKLARALDQTEVKNEVDSPVITQVFKVVTGADQ